MQLIDKYNDYTVGKDEIPWELVQCPSSQEVNKLSGPADQINLVSFHNKSVVYKSKSWSQRKLLKKTMLHSSGSLIGK